MIHINNSFAFGDIVELRCRNGNEDLEGVVTTIRVAITDSITYGVSWGVGAEMDHYAVELQLIRSTKDLSVKEE